MSRRSNASYFIVLEMEVGRLPKGGFSTSCVLPNEEKQKWRLSGFGTPNQFSTTAAALMPR
ncbi:MAG: hypothetical protein IPJ38_18645 [Dechloromonas sp.]|uniref:Uncharacterized protein n=1 Tax=Candidatus Dechloromonas phosphorivorans TaxID=2899244 RepID=A0A935K5P9_9RHOO|nr:hypothetical protein [Candidatus Dechloromonas phosphorivorans]